MRPDKHKKRKNAAYKKKHGIPSGNGGKPEKNGATTSHRSGEKGHAEKPTSNESKVAPEKDNAHVRYTMFASIQRLKRLLVVPDLLCCVLLHV